MLYEHSQYNHEDYGVEQHKSQDWPQKQTKEHSNVTNEAAANENNNIEYAYSGLYKRWTLTSVLQKWGSFGQIQE